MKTTQLDDDIEPLPKFKTSKERREFYEKVFTLFFSFKPYMTY